MEERPGPSFDAAFDEAVSSGFVLALERAYDTACEHFVPGLGSNETTFGFNLYHHAAHELAAEAKVLEGVKVASRNPRFRMTAGTYELACHRVGQSAKEDISVSFPNNEGAASTMVESQLWLTGISKGRSLALARKVVIAHLGNAEDGLEAVYLCIPGATDKDRISEWAYSRLLWKRGDTARIPDSRPMDFPPDEQVNVPVVRRKPRRETGDENE
jgi:hypothetical protein